MAYRAPNTYARFVKSANTVAVAGTSRIMGLIGTGINYYEIANEAVSRSENKPYDLLANDNVFEILNVSKKPVYASKNTPNNVFYTEGKNFTLKDGNKICWNILGSPKLTKEVSFNDGAQALDDAVTAIVMDDYLVADGEWILEITYVHPTAGAYRVINAKTLEVMGEYGVSDEFRTDLIPGVKLKVVSTFRANGIDSEESVTNVGDYILFKTTAAKTEREAYIELVNDISTNNILTESIKKYVIENVEEIFEGTYRIGFTNIDSAIGTLTYTITNVNDPSFVISNNLSVGASSLEIRDIPGVAFLFDFVDLSLINENDSIDMNVYNTVKGDAPVENSTFYVTYKYRKSESEYSPKVFYDYTDIVKEYGNYNVAASGSVVNSLSLGAEIAFLNGITSLVCVQAKNDSDYEINVAIDKLQRTISGINNINTIIPLSSSPEVGAHAINHVDLMSSYENSKERMVYLGAGNDTEISKMIEVAKGYKNERAVYVVPGGLYKNVKDTNNGVINTRKIPSCYAAVAVAALGLVNDPAEPLTNKNISGFNSLSLLLMESEKNALAEAGCCVLDQRGTTIFVRHGITTDPTEVNSTEITLVQIKDYVIEAVRSSTSTLYIGKKNKSSVISDITYTLQSILGQFITQEIIISYDSLTVKRSSDDPRQIDVSFEIEAVYPLNYISIQFGFSVNG